MTDRLRRALSGLLLAGLVASAPARDCVPATAAERPPASESAPPQRGPSARALLHLAWDLPVPTRQGAKSAPPASLAGALAELAGEDPRPLLVLRECFVCLGTDDGLLSHRAVDDERTLLLARWFHCVKLPPDVLDPRHPYSALFPGGSSDHVVLVSRDGRLRLSLDSQRPRAELWGAMVEVLRASGLGDPLGAVARIQGLLDGLDGVDAEELRHAQRLEQLNDTDGSEGRKIERRQSRLSEARAEREVLLRQVLEASRLDPELDPAPVAGQDSTPPR